MALAQLDYPKTIGINPLDLINIKEILGCFHYLFANNINLNINRIERDYSVSSQILKIEENANKVTVKTEDDVYFKSNENIKMSFVINTVRYSFHSFVNSIFKEGEFLFNIPTSINYDDKRSLPRISLPTTTNNSLELSTGTFLGVKIKGKINDISYGGIGFTPDNIVSLRGSKSLDNDNIELKTGDKFKNLKLTIDKHILKVPGEICHTPDDENPNYGIRFNQSKSAYSHRIKDYMKTYLPNKKFINFLNFYNMIKSC